MALGERNSFSSLIIKIAIAAIALSLAVMIIATAVVIGFKKEISAKVFGFSGHIVITGFDNNNSYEDLFPISRDKDFYPHLDTVPGIKSISTFAHKTGILTNDEAFEGIILKGVGSDYDWEFFERYLQEGASFRVVDSTKSKSMLISSYTADRLKLKVEDKVLVHFVERDRQKYRQFFISGIYKTGLKEFDERFGLIDIGHIARLNKWQDDEVGGFMVQLDDIDDLEKMNDYIDEEVLDFELRSRTVRQISPGIFEWLELQNINERLILGLMILVGIINMITALLILILERTNMIGILKALGSSNSSVRKVFLYNAGYIILVGLLIGNFLGIGICLFQDFSGLLTLPEDSYYLKVVPINFSIKTILALNFGTFLISLLALIIPSFLISYVNPIKAIRFE